MHYLGIGPRHDSRYGTTMVAQLDEEIKGTE